jgi:hypothetical protein
MMARGAISVQITGDYNNRDIKRAIADLQLLDKQGGATSGSMARMSGFAAGMGAAVAAAALTAVAAGARMALEFGVNGVKAFIDDEAAAAKLATTMKNLGMEGATAAVEANVDALQRQFGVADDLLRPSMGKLLRVTNDVGKANELMSLALDVSAGSGRSLEQVTQALSRAAGGNALALGRIAPELDKNILKSGNMNAIAQELARTFGGQAQTAAGTYKGQLDRLSVAFGELQESFGSGFLGALGNTESKTDDLMQAMKDLQPALKDVGTAAGNLVVDLSKMVIASDKGSKAGKRFLEDPNWEDLATLLRETGAANAYLASTFVTSLPLIGPYVDGLLRLVGAYDALNGAAQDAYGGVSRTAMAMGKGTPDIDANSAATMRYTGLAKSLDGVVKTSGGNLKSYFEDMKSVGGSTDSAAEKAVILTEKQQNLAERMAGSQVAMKQVTDELEALRKASDEYAGSITGAIQGTVDLSAAFSSAQKASQEGTLAAGESVVSTTIANFQAQILAAKAFADSLTAIEGAGGSQALIDQILKVASTDGPGAGAFLANTLVAEGVVPELTSQLASFDVFATEAGTALADKFYAQGITSAVSLLSGLSKEVASQKKMLERLGQNIGQPVAVAIAEEIAQAIRDGIADGRVIAARRRAEATAAASFVALSSFPAVAAASFSGGGMVNLPGRAAGGPVMAGSPYLVGERGPELFISGSNGSIVPNNQMGGNSYQITVQAGVGDPRAIGQQIVEYIRRFEQASGPAFVAA